MYDEVVVLLWQVVTTTASTSYSLHTAELVAEHLQSFPMEKNAQTCRHLRTLSRPYL